MQRRQHFSLAVAVSCLIVWLLLAHRSGVWRASIADVEFEIEWDRSLDRIGIVDVRFARRRAQLAAQPQQEPHSDELRCLVDVARTMPASSMAQPATTPTPTSSVKLSDSMCAPQYAASLKCLDEANYDKSKCQEFFDAYKECKKQERELRLEANRKSKRFF